MASFLLALQFLTVIPIRVREAGEKQIASSVIYFPLAGLLLGSFLAALNLLLTYLDFSYVALNIILVVALAIITGGMHLDGLSDTADAFLSGKPKEEMLNIMRDSHAGVMGVLSLVSVLLLKIALLSSMTGQSRIAALIMMCVFSRWSAVLVMFCFSYARDEGKAGVFMRGMNLKVFILSSVIVVICAALAWQIAALIVLLIIAGCAYGFGKFATKRIGGITGDTLGAGIELTEIITLLSVFILGNI